MTPKLLRALAISVKEEAPADAVTCDLCLEPSTDAAEFNMASGFRAVMCLACLTEVVRAMTPSSGRSS